MSLTETTIKKRKQIKQAMDNFMDFQWRGRSAFESYGMFILNDRKGSLKFYNGPGFSNEYSKPQFSTNGGDLVGVSFNKQTISFSVGVYWFSIEEYRSLINWLDPLAVDYIIFDHEPAFRYNVKLSKISDSTRWIVGNETINGIVQPRYYTELSLTFELQGSQCAKGVYSYELIPEAHNTTWDMVRTWKIDKEHDFIQSDLNTPFEFSYSIPLTYSGLPNANSKITEHLKVEMIFLDGETKVKTIPLYNLELKNLTYYSSNTNSIHIKYNSETGLLFLKYGTSYEQVLSELTTSDTGDRIVSSFEANKFYIPGRFSFPDINKYAITIKLTWQRSYDDDPTLHSMDSQSLTSLDFICYPRTNIA